MIYGGYAPPITSFLALFSCPECAVIPAYKSKAAKYTDYEEYVAASLKEADMKVAEGTMKYYTDDDIRTKLEDVLNENI